MTMGWFQRLSEGLSKTRKKIAGELNVLFEIGPQVGDEFWDDLEATLIMADIGAGATDQVVTRLREQSQRESLTGVRQVQDALVELLADAFTPCEADPFEQNPSCVLFVGVNGAGKTTTVGKIASEAKGEGRRPIIGSADTFRAAAIEQLEVWGERAGVEVVKRERGSDPASVCYDTIEAAERLVELARLGEAVLARGRVDDEHDVHRHARALPRHLDDLCELTQQVDRGVEAPGRVDEDEVAAEDRKSVV